MEVQSKNNVSLKSFSGILTALVVAGGLGLLVGLIMAVNNSGYYGNPAFVAVGYAIMSLGGGLFGLAIFGAFLRITAKSIIEGLGGNLETSIQSPVVASSSQAHDESGPVSPQVF